MLFIFGAIFSIIDIKSHRVPNRLLAIYLLVALFQNHNFSLAQLMWILILFCVFFVAHLYLKLGAGDVKYMVISSLYIGTDRFEDFFIALWISSIAILIGTIAYRVVISANWRGSIAYIPAIFTALLIY